MHSNVQPWGPAVWDVWDSQRRKRKIEMSVANSCNYSRVQQHQDISGLSFSVSIALEPRKLHLRTNRPNGKKYNASTDFGSADGGWSDSFLFTPTSPNTCEHQPAGACTSWSLHFVGRWLLHSTPQGGSVDGAGAGDHGEGRGQGHGCSCGWWKVRFLGLGGWGDEQRSLGWQQPAPIGGWWNLQAGFEPFMSILFKLYRFFDQNRVQDCERWWLNLGSPHILVRGSVLRGNWGAKVQRFLFPALPATQRWQGRIFHGRGVGAGVA